NIRLTQVELARVPVSVKRRACISNSSVRQGILGIDLHSTIVHLPGVLHALASPLMEILLATKEEIIRVYVDDARLLDRLLLSFSENHPERFHNRLRYVILNGEYVFQFAVVTFRPEVISVSNIHQLRSDAELVPHLAHTSLEHGRHLELAADVADVLVLPLECERRRARSNTQRLDLRQ